MDKAKPHLREILRGIYMAYLSTEIYMLTF